MILGHRGGAKSFIYLSDGMFIEQRITCAAYSASFRRMEDCTMHMTDSTFALVAAAPRRTALAPKFVASAMVFLGAFLAFSMEPIVGRMVTPYFGGAVHVWTVSLMLFQALLLSGYLYAHFIAPRIGGWHLLILLTPLLQWPLNFTYAIAPQAPIATLTVALLTHISLFFAVLSTTAVLAQSWWYSASLGPHRSAPYFLYSVSNLGAMVALFAYPFLVEPLFGVTTQRWAWSVGFLLYAGATICTWLLLKPNPAPCKSDDLSGEVPPSKFDILMWLALSAAPSALLLATTNVIAFEVGSISLIWVIPLALYLASFIFAFRARQGWLVRAANFWQIEITVIALIFGCFAGRGVWVIAIIILCLFAICLISHGRLYRLRPHPNHLTAFYLTIASGGLIGGMLVSLVAPMVFNTVAEYPLAVLIAFVTTWRTRRLVWWKAASLPKGGMRLAIISLLCAVLGSAYWFSPSAHVFRNFYGITKIIDRPATLENPAYRMLEHGATVHGAQFIDSDRRHEPLSYYYVGGALEEAAGLRARPARAATIGLGAGASMMWFSGGEHVDIFEIDPDIETLARQWFSYLNDTPAAYTVHIGDARLNLIKESQNGAPQYDVILVDAFSGDGIPTHLLTLEALDIYLSRLTDGGILVFHISNRYYDLRPILKAAAEARGLAAVATLRGDKNGDAMKSRSEAVVIARRSESLAHLLLDKRWFALSKDDGLSKLRVWTDDYVNVLAPLWLNWSRQMTVSTHGAS